MESISGHAAGPRRNKGARVAVRQYKPQTAVELSALARLTVPRSNAFREKEFRRLVLCYLATIQELTARPPSKKRFRRTEDLRGQVKRVRTAIRRLVDADNDLQGKSDLPRLSSSQLAESVRCLNFYLESLEMELLSASAAHQHFRHSVSPQSLEIFELVTLVRTVTGQPHWENLAILLKGATGDAGMNRKRLFQLYQDRENRRERTLGVFRRARLRVAVEKLRLP